MIELIGGPDRDRTDDLFHAMVARSLELAKKHENILKINQLHPSSVISLRIHTACPLAINAAIC